MEGIVGAWREKFEGQGVSQSPAWEGFGVVGRSRGGRLKIFSAGGRSGSREGVRGCSAAGGAWCGRRRAAGLITGVAARLAQQRSGERGSRWVVVAGGWSRGLAATQRGRRRSDGRAVKAGRAVAQRGVSWAGG